VQQYPLKEDQAVHPADWEAYIAVPRVGHGWATGGRVVTGADGPRPTTQTPPKPTTAQPPRDAVSAFYTHAPRATITHPAGHPTITSDFAVKSGCKSRASRHA